jgi:uncharacterized protein (TIGR01777 family)
MNILISGATGLVGTDLAATLSGQGHVVGRLSRPGSTAAGKTVSWDPERGTIDRRGLEGFDAVVHLAGENIASGRWNAAKKARIKDSRVKGTRLLCENLAQLERPPKTLLSASAIGYYGSRGDEVLTEQSHSGAGFLAEVCREWEAATTPARERNIRVVLLRLGVILTPKGGSLAKMLVPFRLGAGGRIGDGRQYFSWIMLDDVIGAIEHCLRREEVSGAVNVVAPTPVTNGEFTQTLGRVLSRPTIFPMPAFAARLAFGEMADELLLSSQRVEPAVLKATGYSFRFPELEPGLRAVLDRRA